MIDYDNEVKVKGGFINCNAPEIDLILQEDEKEKPNKVTLQIKYLEKLLKACKQAGDKTITLKVAGEYEIVKIETDTFKGGIMPYIQ